MTRPFEVLPYHTCIECKTPHSLYLVNRYGTKTPYMKMVSELYNSDTSYERLTKASIASIYCKTCRKDFHIYWRGNFPCQLTPMQYDKFIGDFEYAAESS